ncbi:MAG: hypothetical protein L0Y56_04365 [Nitrospira sp.]|nr:hypothetical protein [Nitrospira sp.]
MPNGAASEDAGSSIRDLLKLVNQGECKVMLIVEQAIIIKAPMVVVLEALNQVENIPTWATVTGTIDNIQGSSRGMTYEWHYTIGDFSFGGKSEVIEQTETTLITRTLGDVESLWTINLTSIGRKSTAMRVVVEYTPPNIFIEVLADMVLHQLNDPQVARENIVRFKEMVEKRAVILEEQAVVNH